MHFKLKTLATTILIIYYYLFRVIDCLSAVNENKVHSESQDEQHRSKRFIFLRTAGMGVRTQDHRRKRAFCLYNYSFDSSTLPLLRYQHQIFLSKDFFLPLISKRIMD